MLFRSIERFSLVVRCPSDALLFLGFAVVLFGVFTPRFDVAVLGLSGAHNAPDDADTSLSCFGETFHK